MAKITAKSGDKIDWVAAALREAEELLKQFVVLNQMKRSFATPFADVRPISRIGSTPTSWAYAEHYGLPTILLEDLQDGRRYGSVRVVNPFVDPHTAL